ncbi:RNA polymerase sigma factor [Sulfobacillus harzensis]|uniref:Sigma-70 family RNA polymerase sigma factor n=1 Tax=Sulfobacillus harzensis TaxID=2729629 RepID=A0A7Y0L1C7_9FIRM|nr:sigma-70 family RNA polymerase sigma factor [Sulfobacillus harzensis]NMP21492.1 sigma-70 family RNA polymerase sigma factor [Sulfobacillus harzensis]
MGQQSEPSDASLEWWVDTWGDRLVRYAYVMTRDHHLAQDVVQETFIKLMVFQRRYPERVVVPGWLFTTARRVALTLLRRRPEVAADVVESSGSDAHIWIPPAFRELVDTLPLLERECVWLFYYADWPTEQIARHLGCKPGAVRGRLFSARQHLRQLWEDE